MSDLLGEILEGRAEKLCVEPDLSHCKTATAIGVVLESRETACRLVNAALRSVAEEVVRRIVVEIEQESSEVHSWREGKLAVLKTGDDIRSLFPTAFGAE